MIKNFKNLKVTVMGLGLHGGGVGSAEFLARQGAKVLVTDLKSAQKLKLSLNYLKKYKNIQFILGQHRSEDFSETDLIIKNPAIDPDSRYLDIAKKHNIPIDTDIGIFFEVCPCPIIGITGSKGKSTTAVLVYKLLSSRLDKVYLAGNIRISALSELKKLNKKSLCVLELSSWQLDDIVSHKKSPSIAVILNLIPDHLNRYKNFQAYVDAKKSIFHYQKKKDFLILNYDDRIVKSFENEARSKVIFFSRNSNKTIPAQNLGAYIKRGSFYYKNEEEPIIKINDLKLKGEHNLYNVLAAITIAKLYHLPNKIIRKVIKNFSAQKGRLEYIGRFLSIKFYNDTTATIPDAVIAAIKSFGNKKKIILIAGGQDKNLNYKDLSDVIIKGVKKLILINGNASEKLYQEIKISLASKIKLARLVVGKDINNMKEAVKIAVNAANKGDIVLLSPGAASFNLFENEFDRGEQFIAAIKEITQTHVP
ncbi:UDP-N-acetylmuramoyl-L-alanine--D-glutamate ligase [bacterium]|nr:MAG: UDP-N-acetylmuramoyl-L-alanine--D-glutamate ligase [bacterium]